MKKTLLALAVLSLSAGAFATGTVTVGGSGSNSVQSSSGTSSYVLGAGSSLSRASNTQTATAFVGGSGNFNGSGNATQIVNGVECAPSTTVSGNLLKGTVTSVGGTSAAGVSQASNASTGTGTGSAQALGQSYAQVAGDTKLTSYTGQLNLDAQGTAFSFVGTNTGVVGKNSTGFSQGATSSNYNSTASGSLFTYTANGVTGDVKSVTTNSSTNVGLASIKNTGCGTGTCVNGPSTGTANAVVEGGATAIGNGSVVNTIKLP